MNPLKIAIAYILTICSTSSAAAQSWDGAYYGASVGLGTGDYTLGVEALDETGPTVGVSGLVYGAHAGVRFQRGQIVYGADARFAFGPSGTQEQAPPDDEGPVWQCNTGECNVSIETLATARAKFGYVTDIRTLVYAAGGLAIAGVDGGIRNSPQQGHSTATGMTYAIGVERITSPFSTVFAELGYYDLGTLTFGTNEGFDPPPDVLDDFTASGNFLTITAGINYKF